jgi:hypothetical protein
MSRDTLRDSPAQMASTGRRSSRRSIGLISQIGM